MSTKLILLDIDDCLSSDRSILVCQQFDEGTLPGYCIPQGADPVGAALINRACEVCGAKVVVISSWLEAVGPAYTLAWLTKNGLLENHLWKPDPCVNYAPGASKRAAIEDWRVQNRGVGPEDVVVIDDDTSLFPDDHPLARRQVLIDGEDGILLRHYRSVLTLFGITDRLAGSPHPASLDD